LSLLKEDWFHCCHYRFKIGLRNGKGTCKLF